MTNAYLVLELWREAERVRDDLDPHASGADRSALDSEVEELRALYQQVLDDHARHVEQGSLGPPVEPDGRRITAAIEAARLRLRETVSQLHPEAAGVGPGTGRKLGE